MSENSDTNAAGALKSEQFRALVSRQQELEARRHELEAELNKHYAEIDRHEAEMVKAGIDVMCW